MKEKQEKNVTKLKGQVTAGAPSVKLGLLAMSDSWKTPSHFGGNACRLLPDNQLPTPLPPLGQCSI